MNHDRELEEIAKRVSHSLTTPGFTLRLWNGTEIGPPPNESTVTLEVRTPAGLRALLFRPNPLKLGEAYIYGDCDVTGNLEDVFPLADQLIARKASFISQLRAGRKLFRYARRSSAAKHAARLTGNRHSRERTRRAVTHHYDLPVDFWRLWLDQQLVYSCAYFETHNATLEAAQVAKLDLICRKLRLVPGERFLDMGCGWGALVCHAAMHYGVNVLGVTLSGKQAEYGTERIRALNLGRQCRIEVRDFRDLDQWGQFDKIASVGAVEHVRSLEPYFNQAYRLIRPEGWFLNHGITTSPTRPLHKGASFLDRYVFPDYHLQSIGQTIGAAEQSGFEVRDVENLREHYALTLAQWHERLVRQRAEVERLSDPVMFRIFDLYLAGTAYEFRAGRLQLHQTLLSKANGKVPSTPLTRRDWYPR